MLGCYRALLWLYPSDLRHRYGRDMTDIFEQVLRSEWARRGMRGVAATGCRAIGELLTIAIPGQLASEWMIATSLLLALNSAVLALLAGIGR